MKKPFVIGSGIFLAGLMCVLPGIASAAPSPITAVSAHYESTPDNVGNYTDPAGNSIRFSTGDDNILVVDTITVGGNQLVASTKTDKVLLHRVASNNCRKNPGCNVNGSGITGEKQFFQYPYEGSPLNHDLKPSRFYNISDVFLSNSVNVAVDNAMSNVDNNIERVDIIFTPGVLSPMTVGERREKGFMVSERWGNNPHKIAAITALDASGRPTSYYTLSKANINNYGNSQFTITHSDGSVTGPGVYSPPSHRYENKDAPVPGGIAGSQTNPLNGDPEYFLSTIQPIRSSFHSFEQLSVPAGVRIYGVSIFGIDVDDSMDLVGLTDVPLDTDHIIEDSADIFGSIGTVFVPAGNATIGIAKEVIAQREVDAGVYEVELQFVVENFDTKLDAENIQVTDDLSKAFAGAASIEVLGTPSIAHFTQPSIPFDGVTNTKLLSGADALAPGATATINLTLRVDIGVSTGIYLNSALVTTADVPGGEINSTDLSDEGNNPDPDGDGYPNGPGEDDPTAILLGPEAGLISVDKSVAKNQVSIGDFVSYSLTIRNNTATDMSDVEVQDTLPAGFSYVEGSGVLVRRGVDGHFGTADDIALDIEPRGTTTRIFGPFEVAGREVVKINYLLKVGVGVVPGRHDNIAIPFLADDPAGNEDAVGVEVVRDSALDQGTLIGVVFNDIDKDGYQDAVNATSIKLNLHNIEQYLDTDRARFLVHDGQLISGNFDEGFIIDRIDGREYSSRSAKLRQVQLRIPLKAGVSDVDFVNGRVSLESAEGSWLEGPLLGGERVEEKRGAVAAGVNNQRIAFFTEIKTVENGSEFVVTIVNDAVAESGIPGVRVASVQGLIMETDRYGRFHLADSDYVERGRGTQFILKVDPATLPQDAEFTTENPRVMRITGSALNRINFGVRLPDFESVFSEVKITTPEHTELQSQLHIDFSTHFLDEELDPIRFDSGYSNIDQRYLDQLGPLLNGLRDKENIHVQTIGHTDTVPLKSATADIYGDNQGLSEARAEAVADIIRRDAELGGVKVQSSGRSFKDPLGNNNTEKGRASNRRVEVQIVYDHSIEEWVKVPVVIPERTVIEKRPLLDGGMLWATEDPSLNDPRLDIEADSLALIDDASMLAQSIEFSVYSNYSHFIKRWELSVYASNDAGAVNPILLSHGESLISGEKIVVESLPDQLVLKDGKALAYSLRVFDEEGHWDETIIKSLPITSDDTQDQALNDDRLLGQSSLKVQSIPVQGSRIRIYGAAVSDEYSLSLNDQALKADGKGAFVSEQHLPIGEHSFQLSYVDATGASWQRDLVVDVKGDYLFMVGLANLTIGGNNASGFLQGIDEGDQFDDDSFVNARGAFYLKGKIKGKYLVTAQLDTREDEFRQLDNQLKRKDTTTLFRQLDPERYYPVYGDDSTTYSDVDTQGAYYVRVDWDKSRALWGNFNTDITANEFAHYNRSLYGAQLVYRTPEITEFGDHKNLLTAFASEAQSASGHNEFRATGGSLYYLRKTDLVTGSEKLWIEIREKDSIQVLERYALRAGVDYEVDYFQGRILLNQPLSQIAQRLSPSIIQDAPLQGDSVFLLADYEYVPDDFNFENVVGGVRGKTWIGDSLGLGATVIQEERDAEDYSLEGVDLVYKVGKGTYLKGEFAQSESSQADGFFSDDGGLTFTAGANQNALERKGEAKGIELRLDLAELSDNRAQGELKAWYKDRDEGFSSTRDDSGVETQDRGIRASWSMSDTVQLSLLSKERKTAGTQVQASHSAQADAVINERLSAGIEIQRSEKNGVAIEDQDATLMGGKLTYKLSEHTNLYSRAQTVVDSTDAYEDNDQFTLGVDSRVNESLILGAEAISGDRGDGLILGVDYTVSEKANVKASAGIGHGVDSMVGANYQLENGLNLYGNYAQTTDNNQDRSTLTLGQRMKLGNATEVYAENQLTDTDNQAGLTHVLGLDYGLSEYTGVSFSLQRSSIDYDDREEIKRNAATVGLYYKRTTFKASTKLEYRQDRSDIDTTQWLTNNTFEWKASRDYRWLGKYAYSVTNDDDNNANLAKFIEASVGFAYRPALNDRFNLLSRLTWVYDLPSAGQDTAAVDERSFVLATEAAFALNPRWEIGGKLATKKGEIRQQRDAGVWFDSTTNFYAARLRYHMTFAWDGLAEYRWLENVQDEVVRSGALLALYRHVGEHVKLGLGFNFTDFNDDLTRLDYDNQGWFLDITAKY